MNVFDLIVRGGAIVNHAGEGAGDIGVSGGKIAAMTAVDTTTMTPVETLPVYAGVFEMITYLAIGAGFLLFVLSPLFLKRWLHGVE